MIPPLENGVLNGRKGNPELPNRKTGIGSLTLQIGIAPFRSILLNFKKNEDHERLLAIVLQRFENNLFGWSQFGRSGKNNSFLLI